MRDSENTGIDHPIWTALTTKQSHLGFGDALARRYHADVAPFAALASETPAAQHALRSLLQSDEKVILKSSEAIVPVDGLYATPLGELHQMVAGGEMERAYERDVIRLHSGDFDDMYALVRKTNPGPFGKRTREMGNFVGIRDGERLIAMAGERMCFEGYVEISAVCVDDQYRGNGLAGRLMKVLQREIWERGATPFLHVFSNNTAAIGLYERLGFVPRRSFHLTRVGLTAIAPG